MLNEALKQIRLFHRMRQKDLALKLDISNSFLSEIEKGQKSVSIELIKKYADIFNLSASAILLFSENLEDNVTKGSIRSPYAKKVLRIMNWISEGIEYDEIEKRQA